MEKEMSKKRIVKGQSITFNDTEFVEATDLVPKKMRSWFWDRFSENASFSFGDNNRTLITAERFADHAKDVMEMAVEDGCATQEEADKFLAVLEALGQTYIDLEN